MLGGGAGDGDSRTARPASTISYRVIEQWPIANGGYGRRIVVEPKNRNEADLRALSATLKYDTRADRNAFVSVFTDERAARMQSRAAFDLSEAEGLFYDQHFIAGYTRNINTGYLRLSIFLDGPNGRSE